MPKEPLGNLDPDVKIPAAVLAASARATEMFNAMRDQPPPTTDPAPEQPPTTEDPPVTSEGNDQPPLTAEPAPDPAPAPEPAPDPAPAPTHERDWERDYKAMHGRFLKAQETIKQQGDAIDQLQRVLATMQVPAQPSEATETSVAELIGDVQLTPEETSEYGDDFMRVVEKKAKQAVAPIIKRYEAEIAGLKHQLNGVATVMQTDAQENVKRQLTELVPDWQQLNTDEHFLAWLALPDSYSGVIRKQMLNKAYAQGDAHRVAAFFKGFLAEEAALAPAKTETHIGAEVVPKVPLENLAAPGRAKTAAATQAPAEKPILTRAQIAAFYVDVRAGKYRGNDAEKNRLEKMIFEAQADGRIR